MCSKGKKSIWTGLCVWGQHYYEILIALGGLRLGGNCEDTFGDGPHKKNASGLTVISNIFKYPIRTVQ